MPVTQPDERTALVVIDLQQGIVALPVTPQVGPVIERASQLAAAFRSRPKPVVLVNVDGGAPGRNQLPPRSGSLADNGSQLIPQMTPQDGDITLTKKQLGAFLNTDLHAQLQQHGVTQVVICGIATSPGVESTAREAYALGYNVTLATDAMADLHPQTHDNSIGHIFPRLGETGTVAEILPLLV